MKVLEILTREHELIQTYLDTVALAVRRLKQGESVPRAFFDNVVTFARDFVDKHHHFKEEYVMFEMLARKKNALAEQSDQLQHEHERGRFLVSELQAQLDDYQTDPERMRASLLESVDAFVSLLRHHIDLEDHVFYPLARRTFTPQEQSQLLEEFRSLLDRDARSLARHQAMVMAMGELLNDREVAVVPQEEQGETR